MPGVQIHANIAATIRNYYLHSKHQGARPVKHADSAEGITGASSGGAANATDASTAPSLANVSSKPLPSPLYYCPGWLQTVTALLCTLIVVVPLLRWPLWTSLVTSVVLLVGVWLTAIICFLQYHRVFLVATPVVAIVLAYNGVALYEYGRTRATLGRFVGREMLQRTLHLLTGLQLGGNVEVATAFFSDLRGYSTLSEFLPPDEVTTLLNEYTEALVTVVRKHRGRPIDFLGDGVFVIFEQRLAGADHAGRAIDAALEAQEVFSVLREEWIARGAPLLEVGIAIHTGKMVIGVVGSRHNMKLGAVGDVVNVAARVQGLSRECGFDVLVTDDSYHSAGDPEDAVPCGEFKVKGREQPVQVYGLGQPNCPDKSDTAVVKK
jgi:adenylate cyclase